MVKPFTVCPRFFFIFISSVFPDLSYLNVFLGIIIIIILMMKKSKWINPCIRTSEAPVIAFYTIRQCMYLFETLVNDIAMNTAWRWKNCKSKFNEQ